MQVREKQRVTDFGEVFTGEREVKAMLDLVEDETYSIDSRFLEPACGNGNFLVEILGRKLNTVQLRYRNSQVEFERYTFLAVSSLYGIELLEDNTQECRDRLLNIVQDNYDKLFMRSRKNDFIDSIEVLLQRNIICGDALSLKSSDDGNNIVFSEWTFVYDNLVLRADYSFSSLLKCEDTEDLQKLISDTGDQVYIPVPVRSFKPIHFLKVKYAE